MLMIRPSNVRKNSPFKTRMKPAKAIKSTSARCNSSTNFGSASSSSLVRNFPGSVKRASMFSFLACSRIPDCCTSLSTIATSAGTRPAAHASATATKFEPLPEPKTPTRNLRLPFTRLLYRQWELRSRYVRAGIWPLVCGARLIHDAHKQNRVSQAVLDNKEKGTIDNHLKGFNGGANGSHAHRDARSSSGFGSFFIHLNEARMIDAANEHASFVEVNEEGTEA